MNCIKKETVFCIDIDGVLLAGSTPIKGSSEAIQYLDKENILHYFITNGSTTTEKIRANQLSDCEEEMIVMAQTPLRELKNEHEKLYLVVNQGDCRAIIEANGFKNVITIEELSKMYPILNSFDRHKYVYKKESLNKEINKNIKIEETKKLLKIDGIILLEDPLNWEISYQYILDVIFTNGELDKSFDYIKFATSNFEQIPIYVGASDYFSVSKAPWPRLAHGSFLVGLEAIYKKITGKSLKYTKMYGKPNLAVYKYLFEKIKNTCPNTKKIYFIGDNALTDIYGANVFKQYLKENNISIDIISILVKTGISKGDDNISLLLNLLNDTIEKNPEYTKPDYIFNNIYEFIKFFDSSFNN